MLKFNYGGQTLLRLHCSEGKFDIESILIALSENSQLIFWPVFTLSYDVKEILGLFFLHYWLCSKHFLSTIYMLMFNNISVTDQWTTYWSREPSPSSITRNQFLIIFGCCCCCSRWWKVLFSSSPNGRVCVQKPAQSPRLKLVWFWSTRFKIISANPLNHDCFQLTIEKWNTKVSIFNFFRIKCAVLLHNTKELMRQLIFHQAGWWMLA